MNCPLCGKKVLYQGLSTLECASSPSVCANGGMQHPRVGEIYYSKVHGLAYKCTAVGVEEFSVVNTFANSSYAYGIPLTEFESTFSLTPPRIEFIPVSP